MSLLRLPVLFAVLAAGAMPVLPASAASFDCKAASTPFETAICENPALSAADDILAKSFATAMGGLTKKSEALMRAEQRTWLDYAQSACTLTAKPMTSGSYEEDGVQCLVDTFTTRSAALEDSRMLGGHRFLLKSFYSVQPSADAADPEGSFRKVSTHELTLAQLDADDVDAEKFNAYVLEQGKLISDLETAKSPSDLDNSIDTEAKVAVDEVVGSTRITLDVSTYYYGHGAPHGEYSISYLHYLLAEQRGLEASDIFTGDGWQKKLADIVYAQLTAERGELLMVDNAEGILDIVSDPTRWNFDSDYGLEIQFEPYEIAAYAEGAPTAFLTWDKIAEITAPSLDRIRTGY